MSAQNFLSNFADSVKRVIAGDDYLDLDKSDKRTTKQKIGEWSQNRNRKAQSHRVGQKTPAGTTMSGTGYAPFQRTPNAPSSATVNSSPISSPISPKPTAFPKPTNQLTSPKMNARGGIISGLAGAAATYALPTVVEEATRGARMLLGDKNYNTPVNIKSVNGTNYDISTSGGMEAYKKAVSQNAHRERPIGSDTSSSTFNNTAEINARLKQQQAETAAALKKTKGNYDHSTGGYEGQQVSDQTVSVPTRDNPPPNGGSGSGTQTSPGGGMPVLSAATAAQFLQDKGLRLGAFSSIQLPGSPTNPNSGGTIEAQPFSGQETAVTTNTLGAFSNNGVNFAALDNTGISTQDAFTNPALKGVVGSAFAQYGTLGSGNGAFEKPTQGSNSFTEISPTNPIYAEAFGEDLAKKNGSTGSSRLDAALADTAGMRSYMSKFGSPEQDRRRAAEMAFLNTEGPGSSLMGVRAKEDVLGQFYAGGKTYQLNDAGTELLQSKKNGKPLAMDPKAASSYRLGTSTSEDYKNSYKDKVKSIMPATPKQAEAPSAQNPEAVTEQPTAIQREPLMRQTVDPNIIENYDFTKEGAEDAYFGPGGILEKATKR